MEKNISPIQSTDGTGAGKQFTGCLQIFIFVFALLWTAGTAIITLAGGWFIEQAVVEGSIKVPDFRWILILMSGILILVPMVILQYFTKSNVKNKFYRTWSVAAVFMLLMFPSRFLAITDFQAVMLVQIGLMAVFIAGFHLWQKQSLGLRAVSRRFQNRAQINVAIVLGLLPAIPWVIFGALGSVWDIGMAMVNCVLFGISAGLVFKTSMDGERQAERDAYRFTAFLSDGLALSIALLVMTAGIAQNGIQIQFFSLIPILGWGCALLARSGLQQSGDSPDWRPGAVLVGLSTLWPLAWVDPDELMMVIGMGAGESISVAGRATWIGLLISLIAICFLWFFGNKPAYAPRPSSFLKAVPWLLFLAIAALHLFAGRPGLFGERLFVIMKEQADVSFGETISDYSQRRAEVYKTLTEHAEYTQKDIRSSLEQLKIEYRPYYLVNAIEVNAGPLARLWLMTRPDVDRVLDNPMLRPLPEDVSPGTGAASLPASPDWNLTSIGADRVWDEFNVTGKGVVVGQSDSGVQGNHPELADSYRGREDGDDYNWFDPWNHTMKPTDIGGHGTHTLGSIAGNRVGVAPDADWIGCVNLARNLGNPSYYLDCMQFMLAPFPQNGDPFKDGKPEKGAMILNNSWGCPEVEGCDPGVFLPAVKALQSAGIFVVVSAGNSGYSGCGSVESPPAIYDEVYSVGAYGPDGQLTDFSSLGPVTVDGSNRVKPDIAAPGGDVLSAYPNSTYEIASGTSMAGPHVVGVVALMWSANPDLVGDIKTTRSILNQSASVYEGSYPLCVNADQMPNNAVGFGKLNAYQSVKLALQK